MFASKDTLLTRPSGYNIARSVRFRSSASAYLNRTFSTPTNSLKWTWSGWVKNCTQSGYNPIFGTDSNSGGLMYFHQTDNALQFYDPSTGAQLYTTALYRDPSAWYHVLFVYDSTQATAADRMNWYVNGVKITSFAYAAYPSQNASVVVNTAVVHYIGRHVSAGTYANSYMTEVNFVDGQALTPSSFGETDSITGVWKPKAYSGTYGTNGFELNFSDNSASTAATIGKDYSGNGNNWTPNNISVTAGVTYDSMQDVPTLTSATAANYAVMNPLNKTYSTYTLSDGNLNWTSSTINMGSHGTFQLPTSGKYYWEVVMTVNAGSSPAIGIADGLDSLGNKGIEYRTSGNKEQNGGVSGNGSGAYGATWTTNDVIGIAYDADTSSGQITFYKNNSSQGVAYSSIQTNFPNGLFPSFQNNAAGTTTFQANFGQRPFTYTPPTGFVALNTYNLPDSTVKNGAAYMAATLYTGTGASLTVANTVGSTSFQPDWVWAKSRSAATDHALYDSVRGVQKQIESNSTGAETTETTGLTAFGSTGFTVGALAQMNTSAATYVAWQWKAGTTSASNTNGSITSTVSAGATQGFSVVTYTGTGANATVGHGLGVALGWLIVKRRTTAGGSWVVWHNSFAGTERIDLDSTAAKSTDATAWNSTSPSSSVFSIGTSGGTNLSAATYVAYCFSAVAGYSAFGSYTGNGSNDGPFVFLGFRPRWVLVKNTGQTNDWFLMDSSMNTYNVIGDYLHPNTTSATVTFSWIDFLSNGFKIRSTSTGLNNSSIVQIYAAFAENPFKNALAR